METRLLAVNLNSRRTHPLKPQVLTCAASRKPERPSYRLHYSVLFGAPTVRGWHWYSRAIVLFLAVCVPTGCGVSGGELLFVSGLVPSPTVKAEFKLTEGPVAVLVDDYQEIAYWSEVRSMLADQLVQELGEHGAARSLISNAKVNRLRQADAQFDQRSCRQTGRRLGAEQIIWMQVREFHARVQPADMTGAAQMSVVVKVFDVHQEDRTQARLWPRTRTGAVVIADLSAGEVTDAKTRGAIARKLAEKLAEQIAKKFYDYHKEAFGRG